MQLVRRTGRTSAYAFLEALIAPLPDKIHAVLTDNGIQLTFPPRYADKQTAWRLDSRRICLHGTVELEPSLDPPDLGGRSRLIYGTRRRGR